MISRDDTFGSNNSFAYLITTFSSRFPHRAWCVSTSLRRRTSRKRTLGFWTWTSPILTASCALACRTSRRRPLRTRRIRSGTLARRSVLGMCRVLKPGCVRWSVEVCVVCCLTYGCCMLCCVFCMCVVWCVIRLGVVCYVVFYVWVLCVCCLTYWCCVLCCVLRGRYLSECV